MTATLASLRTRIRTQVEKASGVLAPLEVTPSSIDLATSTPNLRGRLETILQDSGNAIWSTDDLDEAIRWALEQLTSYNPFHAIDTVTLGSDGREVDISTLSDILRIEKVWWPYTSATPTYPPNWIKFEVWPGDILFIDTPTEPATNDVVRIYYTQPHTIKDLDSAAATTVPEKVISPLLSGAAQHAAFQRAIELSEQATIDDDVVSRLMKWADQMGKNFRYLAKERPYAWQRYAYGYSQIDLDEAIRWALHRYSKANPQRKIESITLTADGREIDISSITNLLQVERVWWDYDSSDPNYPPNWRNFELWPGDLLYIKDSEEPVTGDVVRVWHTAPHTLNGLDSETATTIPLDDETLVVIGASGFVTQERAQDEHKTWVPTKLREWAEGRLKEFEKGLSLVQLQKATRHSGIAKTPTLDSWDTSDDWR